MSKSSKITDKIKGYLAKSGISESDLERIKQQTKDMSFPDKAKHLMKTYSIGKVILILAILIGGTLGVIFLIRVIQNVIGGMDIGGALNSALQSINPMNALGDMGASFTGALGSQGVMGSLQTGGSGLLDGIKNWGSSTFSREKLDGAFKGVKDLKLDKAFKSKSDGWLKGAKTIIPKKVSIPKSPIKIPTYKPPKKIKIKPPKIKKIKVPKFKW